MTDKRRFITQLPARNQTETLKKFFGATVDNVFQPGKAETLTGYIGERPSYNDPSKDFYITEPTKKRQAYQLSPAMITTDEAGEYDRVVFYDDFINYIENANGNVSDHNRLLADDYYSWAPPVDIDKLTNYAQYIWFGDVPNLLPVLKLTAAKEIYTADGIEKVFDLPVAVAGIPRLRETPLVFVDGVRVDFDRIDETVSLVDVPAEDAVVTIFRYGNLARTIEGSPSFDPTAFIDSEFSVSALAAGMRVSFDDGINAFAGFDVLPFEAIPTQNTTDYLDGYVEIPFDNDSIPTSYWVDGVGDKITLIPYIPDRALDNAKPEYVVIDRRSTNRNPWSRINFWVHADSLAWSGQKFTGREAQRPIIEFIPNIELFDYGFNRLDDVNGLVTVPPRYDSLAQGEASWNVANNGYVNIALNEINGKIDGSVYVDNRHLLKNGDKILVLKTDNPELLNRILTITTVTQIVEGEPALVYGAIASPRPKKGDIVRLVPKGFIPWDGVSWDSTQWDYDSRSLEYYFDGSKWIEAQRRIEKNDPLFAVYNDDWKRLSEGNRIFGYADGTIKDRELLRSVKYDNFGMIVFENDIVTKQIDGNVGFQYYHYTDADTFANGWFISDEKTSQTVVDGIHSIPLNLVANPDNDEVEMISRSQWLDHFTSILSRQEGFAGSPYGRNNWRFTPRELGRGNVVIQNRSPLLKTMLLTSDDRFDLPSAIRFVEQKYVHFRNRFTKKLQDFLVDGTVTTADSPEVWVSTILENLALGELDGPFSLSNMAGGNYFIPPTPSAMGILPCVRPGFEEDSSFGTTIKMIRGHDGSRVPAFEDFKDDIILALEMRIYDAIDSKFKNETKPLFDFYDFVEGRFRNPSSARYSRNDMISFFSSSFVKWAQINNFDYRTNANFDSTDPFTWNYTQSRDRYGNALFGSWRAIYSWYFDTETPNTKPWEMLGFAEKPEWFEDAYGAAPYTRGNTVLWEDIRDGRIAAGLRAGIDTRFVRPNLFDILPVDEDGNLLDPIRSGLVNGTTSVHLTSMPWAFGDRGPVESLWVQSSSYRFIQSLVAFLMRPAQFVELTWDTLASVRLPDGQFVNKETHNRPHCSQLYVHGETDADGAIVVHQGVQQWISDYMASSAQEASILGNALRKTSVRLAHKVAGFTQQNGLRVFADNFGLVPQEDYKVLLNDSSNVRHVSYSGVIVEWIGTGWRVFGYDNIAQSFTVERGDRFGPRSIISLGDDPVIFDWKRNIFYKVGTLVAEQGYVYRCIKPHTSTGNFEAEFWSVEPSLSQGDGTNRVSISLRTTGVVEKVPYDTKFDTLQEVVDFISDYARHLETSGWVFDSVDDTTGEISDWSLAIKAFLTWAKTKWAPGNIISLSPGAAKLKFVTKIGYTLNAETSVNGGYGLLDRSGAALKKESTFVTRLDEETFIETISQDLFAARLRVAEIEHVLIFNNFTIFSDTIYEPLFNLRQPRLRVIGTRTTDWNGRLDTPGYIVSGNDLIANFDRSAENIREMFDIEHAQDKTLRDYARHVIGYQTRPYLDNLLLSETQQFEFFQGMIHSKGTPVVFDRLSRSNFVDQGQTLRFLEEWAFKIGRYGAVAKSQTVAFELISSDLRGDPQFIRFGDDNLADTVIDVSSTSNRWVQRPSDTGMIFPYMSVKPEFEDQLVNGSPLLRQNGRNLPSAGYVRIGETEYAALRNENLNTVYFAAKDSDNPMEVGSRIWVYITPAGSWDVLEAMNLGSSTNRLARVETISEDSNLVNTIRLTMTTPHGLVSDDEGLFILVSGSSFSNPDVEGFRKIQSIENSYSIILDEIGTRGVDLQESFADEAPVVYVMRSRRYANSTARDAFKTRFPTSSGLVYVDDSGDSKWQVQQFIPAVAGTVNTPAVAAYWKIVRQEPRKIDTAWVNNALVYAQESYLTDVSLSPEPLLLDGITIFDPIKGFIPGEAEAEISFKTEYDPARYGNTSGNQWGMNQVGTLWWDLGAVRFIDCETDAIDLVNQEPTRIASEVDYRVNNWGKIAPGTSVDIYEWTRSFIAPKDYTDGEVIEPLKWLEKDEFDADKGKTMRVYYFWTRNRQDVPAGVRGRTISASSVSGLIANPSSNDLAWIAPIFTNGMLVSNIEEYLTSKSVLQFDIRDPNYDGVVHEEWKLTRKADDDSIPDETLLNAARDSLVGFDEYLNSVPDMNLPENDRTGISVRPRRSMFKSEKGNSRQGILDGRKAFVQTINAILSKTNLASTVSNAITLLDKQTPVSQKLFWSKTGNETFLTPPDGAFDFVADGYEGRDAIMESAAFINLYEAGSDPKILVTNYNSTIPSWGIWHIDPTVPEFESNDARLKLVDNYDLVATTRQDAKDSIDAGTLLDGKIVLIQSDENHSGFWTICKYSPGTAEADADDLVVIRAQTYRTKDFWKVVDWYADGYSISSPPTVSYATASVRANREGNDPSNVFVKLNDDGTGRWIWQAYRDGEWVTVARQNATVNLDATFYDPNRIVYGLGTQNLAHIDVRDGSFEMREIFNTLVKEILTYRQINDMFFGLLHFIHVQQDQIDWAFKTSFLSVVGYDTRMDQNPVILYDNTQNLIDYVNEVKPYRVKLRDFSSTLTGMDFANVHVTDFDKPIWFDETTQQYRRLDPTNPNDIVILQTNSPWKEWYANYLKTGTNPATPDYNPVRRFDITFKFDRIDPFAEPLDWPYGWDRGPWDSWVWDGLPMEGLDRASSLVRMQLSYQPKEGMRSRNPYELYQLGFKGVVVNGGEMFSSTGDLSVWDIHPYDEQPLDTQIDTIQDIHIDGSGDETQIEVTYNPNDAYYRMLDPYYGPGHPEELVRLNVKDSLSITVQSVWVAGAPSQFENYLNTFGTIRSTAIITYPEVAQRNEGIFVYRDGVRVYSNEYVVDHFLRTVDVSLIKDRARRLREEDGIRLREESGFRLLENDSGDKASTIVVHTFGFGGDTPILEQRFFTGNGVDGDFELFETPMGFVEVVIDGVPYNQGETGGAYEVTVSANTVNIDPAPENNADIVINVREGTIGSATYVREEILSYDPDNGDDQLWTLSYPTDVVPEYAGTIAEVEGVRLSPPTTRYATITNSVRSFDIGTIADDTDVKVWIDNVLVTSSVERLTDIEDATEDFAIVDGEFFVVNSAINGRVVLAIYDDYDYDVVGGVLIINPLIGATTTSGVVATTFTNATSMGVETHVFYGSTEGVYTLDSTVPNINHITVTVNGFKIVGKVDFDYHYEDGKLVVTVPNAQREDQRVVIMLATGRPSEAPDTWMPATRTNGLSMLGDKARIVDPDDAENLIDLETETDLGFRKHYRMNGTLEVLHLNQGGIGYLTDDLTKDSDTVSFRLHPYVISTDFEGETPIMLPRPGEGIPGVIWIGAERIEYFGLERDGADYVLSHLRRGTNHTSIGAEHCVTTAFESNGDSEITVPYIGGETAITTLDDGQYVAMFENIDYTLEVINDDLVVTLNNIPANGMNIFITQNAGLDHKTGSWVRSGLSSRAENGFFRRKDFA